MDRDGRDHSPSHGVSCWGSQSGQRQNTVGQEPLGLQGTGDLPTDRYDAYTGVIPSERHKAITKKARTTNHIERFNNTLRQRVSRLVRETLSFSKKLTNYIGAIKYFICYYNRARITTTA